MASYNPCRYYGLTGRGNVREGYAADLVATSADGECVRFVFKDGVLAAKDQKLLFNTAKRSDETREFENSVHYRDFSAADFSVPERLRNVAIGLVEGQLLTERVELGGVGREGLDILATAERHGRNGNLAVCLVKGYGIKGGAVATSISHDSHNAVCAGDNGEDMALALNRLKEIAGGYVIASGGEIAAELPMPAFGLMATGGAHEVAEEIEKTERVAHSLGVNPGVDAFTTLSFVALPVIPRMRLLDTGLYDTEEGKFL